MVKIIMGNSNDSFVEINNDKYYGHSIYIDRNRKIFVNNEEKGMLDSKELSINIHGKVEKIETESDLIVNGDVGSIITEDGDVSVHGNAHVVQTETGDITIGSDVYEDVVSETGDITIGKSVGGNASSETGDIDIGGSVGGQVSNEVGDINIKREKVKERIAKF